MLFYNWTIKVKQYQVCEFRNLAILGTIAWEHLVIVIPKGRDIRCAGLSLYNALQFWHGWVNLLLVCKWQNVLNFNKHIFTKWRYSNYFCTDQLTWRMGHFPLIHWNSRLLYEISKVHRIKPSRNNNNSLVLLLLQVKDVNSIYSYRKYAEKESFIFPTKKNEQGI